MPSLKLLHLLAYSPRGTRAIDHFVIELTKQSVRRGWEPVFGFDAEPTPEFAASLKEAGGRSVTFKHPLTMADAQAVVASLAGWWPDVTQTSFLSIFDAPVRWLKTSGFTKKLIMLDHGSGTGPTDGGVKRLLRQVRGWRAGRVADAFAPVSRFVANREVEKVFLPAAKVRVIYNGIDLGRFAFAERNPGPVPRVVYAGQLIPEKGVLTLLKAVEELKRRNVPFTLEIAGAGHQRDELQRWATEHHLTDRVTFLGHVDSLPALFRAADVVVAPSEWAEAFGLVVSEAMACGAALLVSDAGGLPEVVLGAGRVFPSGNHVALADALAALLADPAERQRLGTAARKRAEAAFSLAPQVTKQLDLVAAVAAGTPLPPGDA